MGVAYTMPKERRFKMKVEINGLIVIAVFGIIIYLGVDKIVKTVEGILNPVHTTESTS